MSLRLMLRIALLSVSLLIHFITAHGQVTAGISADGRVISRGDTVNVCQGGTVSFRSVAQGSVNINWRFQGGDPFTTATGIGPYTISYNTAGFDTVFQQITGGTFSDSMYIIVQVSDKRPTADFSWSPNGNCGNDPVQFTNRSTGDHLVYVWNFGDGGSSTLDNPSYSFLNAIGASGTTDYSAGLTVVNEFGCGVSTSHVVTVRNTPDASIGSADPDVVSGTFNGTSTFKKCSNIPSYVFGFINRSATTAINQGYTIHWGDGSPDSAFSAWPPGVVISHNFPLGSSNMSVRVPGPNGCTGIKNYNIFLGSTPAGGLASLGNTDICSSDSLRFSITNISVNPPGTLYTFLINDGSPAQVFTHPPPAAVGHYFSTGSCSYASSSGNSVFNNAFGAYLTIENPCGTTSPSVVPIYVSGKPKAGIFVYPSNTVCTNTNVQIDNISTFGALITPTGGTGSTCTNSGTQVWTISPAAGYTIQHGSMGSLNGNPGNGAIWTGGTTDLHLSFFKAGTYTVKVYIFNNRCGMDSTTYTLCVRTPPQASFTLPARTRCGPGVLAITNTSPTGSCWGDSYAWKVSYLDPQGCGNGQDPAYAFTAGSNAGSYSPSLQLNSPGQYILELTVAALNDGQSCSPAVYRDTFTVVGAPKLTLSTPVSACIGSGVHPYVLVDSCYSPGPFTYQWTFAGAAPANAATADPGTIHFGAIGSWPVVLTLTDEGCHTLASGTAGISVVEAPAANAGNDTTLCSGSPLKLGSTALNGVTYRWSPAAGLSDTAAADPLFTADYTGTAADTTYTITLETSVGSGCSSTDLITITIKRSPSVAVIPPAEVCIGQSLQLMAAGAEYYTWSPASQGSNTGNTFTINPVVSTMYTVIGRSADGCADTITVPVTVHPDASAVFTAANTTICSNKDLAGLITITPAPANAQYSWYDNGILIGSDSSAAFPAWSIGTPGSTDTIKLVAISAYGCRPDSMQLLFHSVPGAPAHFTRSLAAGCGPLTIDLINDTQSPSGAQFFWDLGNGQRSTEATPGPVTFPADPDHRDTTYVITLKAYNGCDTTIWKDTVTVYPAPKAAFTVNDVLGCSPFSETLTNLSTGGNTSYHWDFGDGSEQTVPATDDILHVYHTGAIDTFTITLTATNRCGAGSDSLDIVVTPNSIRPNILVNGNALFGCAPFTANFVNRSLGAARIIADFNDGSAPVILPGDQPVITHQYLQAGNYQVTMRLTNSCVDTSIVRAIEVFAAPVPDYSIGPNPVCTGNAVSTINRSAGGNSYLWDWGDSDSSNGQNSTHVYRQAGTYQVRMTASLVNDYGTVCSVSGNPVIVQVADLVPARIDTGQTRPCAPYNLQVTARDVSTARSVQWTFYDGRDGGSFQASGVTASYQYNDPGCYHVMLVVENLAGCTDTSIHSFQVSATPSLTNSSFGTIYTCNTDTTITLPASAAYNGAGPLSYTWDINGTPGSTGSPLEYRFQLAANDAGPESYVIRSMVTNATGCSDTTAAGTLVVRPLHMPHIITKPDSILYQPDYTFSFFDNSVQPQDGIRYIWDLGDQNGTNSGKETTHRYGDTGVYMVQLRVSDQVTGCSKADTVHVRILHIPGFLYVPDAICPGCAVGELRSFLPKGRGLKDYRLRIWNSWGQMIFETTKLNSDGAPGEAWDARWNGQTVKQDAYRWQIEARYVNGTEWKGMLYPGQSSPVKSGFITVVR